MRKKAWIYFGGIVMCCMLTACGTEKSADSEAETDQIVEMEEEDEIYEETETPQETQLPSYNLTYDIVSDVENGLLYVNGDGKLTDPDGNVLPEYDEYCVNDKGSVIYLGDETAVEGYFAEGGKIVYHEPAPIEYNSGSGIEELRNYASWANCTVSVRKLDLAYKSDTTQIDDDGDYFDEVVLGAWFNESGQPIGDLLPQKLADAFLSEVNISTESLKFIDSENCTIDNIKRTSKNKKIIYAFVLTDIKKRGNSDTDVNIVGREFTSGEQLVVHGQFSKILNGDDLLVFGFFNGLASDDTPNFQGHYIQIINGRLD